MPSLSQYNIYLDRDFSDFRPIQRQPVSVRGGRNGLPYKYWQGPAVRNGRKWDLGLDFYKVNNIVVMFTYGQRADKKGKYAPMKGDLRRMVMSIRRHIVNAPRTDVPTDVDIW